MRAGRLRLGFATVLLVIASVAPGASPASAATNEIRFCGPRHGWEITAGNYPPQYPKTRCTFARATYRKVNSRPGSLLRLPRQFQVRVRGVTLGCRARHSRSYAEFRCRGNGRFVLVYKFR